MNLKEHFFMFEDGIDLSGIQLIVQDEPFLFIGRGSHTYVFERGLKELDIPFEKIEHGRQRIVKPSGELYKAVGMGLSMAGKDWFTLSQSSSTYWLSVNLGHLERMKPYLDGYELMQP